MSTFEEDNISEDFNHEAGRRKKRRGLAANLVTKTTFPLESGQPTENEAHSINAATPNGIGARENILTETKTPANNDIVPVALNEKKETVAVTEDDEFLIKPAPIKEEPIVGQNEEKPKPPVKKVEKTAELIEEPKVADKTSDTTEQSASKETTTSQYGAVTSLPTVRSGGSPRLASRAKVTTTTTTTTNNNNNNNKIHGSSNLAQSTPVFSIRGEASSSKRTTPRPLPAHLKQAFTSNSNTPRNSMNASPGHSLTEELTKTLASVTVNATAQPASFLRKVLTRDVKARSYLVGHLGSDLSLRGKSEIAYYFPDNLIRVFAGSWNMSAPKTLPQNIESFILPDYASSDYTSPAPHIFVFGTQESSSDKRRWLLKLQECLGQHFVCLCAPVHGALGMAVFIRRELIWYTSAPCEAGASTKSYQPIATKGSLAVSFEVFGTTFLFINSHFTAGQGNVDARVEDYRRALFDLKLQPSSSKNVSLRQRPSSALSAPTLAGSLFGRKIASASASGSSTPASTPAVSNKRLGTLKDGANSVFEGLAGNDSNGGDFTSQFDCCFWIGDFNFRVNRQREHVDEVIKGFSHNAVHPAQQPEEAEVGTGEISVNNYELLLEHDEMNKEMSRGRVFRGFHEGKIRFKPTYKFDIGSDMYDSSAKSRIQSYTDRIVFRSRKKNAVTCLAYSSVEAITVSDHKPVYGVYDVELGAGTDTVPPGAGYFDREIYHEGLKQRTHVLASEKTSAVCVIQ